jgi:hypothetical protein
MNSSSDILIDLGDDPRGEPRGQIHGKIDFILKSIL